MAKVPPHSEGRCEVSAQQPCLRALRLERRFPSAVRGPVLRRAFSRLALMRAGLAGLRRRGRCGVGVTRSSELRDSDIGKAIDMVNSCMKPTRTNTKHKSENQAEFGQNLQIMAYSNLMSAPAHP